MEIPPITKNARVIALCRLLRIADRLDFDSSLAQRYANRLDQAMQRFVGKSASGTLFEVCCPLDDCRLCAKVEFGSSSPKLIETSCSDKNHGKQNHSCCKRSQI